MRFGCRVHLYLLIVLHLVRSYWVNHILQAEMLFSRQKIFILRERLMGYLKDSYDVRSKASSVIHFIRTPFVYSISFLSLLSPLFSVNMRSISGSLFVRWFVPCWSDVNQQTINVVQIITINMTSCETLLYDNRFCKTIDKLVFLPVFYKAPSIDSHTHTKSSLTISLAWIIAW